MRTKKPFMFQKEDFRRWGPPPERNKIVYNPEGVSAEEVLNASLEELRTKKIKDHRYRNL